MSADSAPPPMVDADDGLVYLPVPSHGVEVLCVSVYLALAVVSACRALSLRGAAHLQRRLTFQRLMVLFAVMRAASFLSAGMARNLFNRGALCFFFSLVLFQVLFWIDIANPQVSRRSRRIWVAFLLANGVFYAMVLGLSLLHYIEMSAAAEQGRSVPTEILWTGVLPVLLIALGSFVSSLGLLYSTWMMRNRVERVLKPTQEGFRRRVDQRVEKKLTHALRFTIFVMSVCSLLFLLRTVIYIQRPFSHQGCGNIDSQNVCIALGYMLPEVVPCTLFIVLMWEVEPTLKFPSRRNLSFNSALVPSESTPLLFDEMLPQQIQIKTVGAAGANDSAGFTDRFSQRSISGSSMSGMSPGRETRAVASKRRTSPLSLGLGGNVLEKARQQLELVFPQRARSPANDEVTRYTSDAESDATGASMDRLRVSTPVKSTVSPSFAWLSFQCFNLKFPSASPSSSFIVVHALDPATGGILAEIGRTEISTSEDPSFHLMLPVEMREEDLLRVTVYSVRHAKFLDDLDSQWVVGDALVPMSSFIEGDSFACGHASLHSLFSPLSRTRSSGEVVVRCEAAVMGADGVMASELERITRSFIYFGVEGSGECETGETDDSYSEIAQQMIHLAANSQRSQGKMLVEEELIESVYTWEVPYQLLQLVLSDLVVKLNTLKRENEDEEQDTSVTSTPSSQLSTPSVDPSLLPPTVLSSSGALAAVPEADASLHQPDEEVAIDIAANNAAAEDDERFTSNRARNAPSIGMLSEMIMQIQDDALERKKRKWRMDLIQRMEHYISEVEDSILRYGATQHAGLTFKPSTMKADRDLRFLALNLHQQLMTVGNAVPTSERDIECGAEANGARYARLVSTFIGTNVPSPMQLSRESSVHGRRTDDLHDIDDDYAFGDGSDDDAAEHQDETRSSGEHAPLEPVEALRRRVISFDSAEKIVNMSVNGEDAGVSSEQRKLAETIVAMGRKESFDDSGSSSSLGTAGGLTISVDTTFGGALHSFAPLDAEAGSPTERQPGGSSSRSRRMAPFHRHRMYGTVTVGAFAAHAYGFKSGGVRQMREELERLHGRLLKEAESSSSDLTVDALDRRYNELKWDVERRLEVVFCQAVSALVTCFQQAFYVHSHDDVKFGPHALRAKGLDYLEMISEIGFLFSVESLLSTYSNEAGMLGDMDGAVRELSRVHIRLKPVKTPRAAAFRVSITSGPAGIVVELPVITCRPSKFPDSSMHRVPGQDAATGAVYLPLSSAEQKQRAKRVFSNLITVVPVIFSQGMNEMQTVANTVGKDSLQKEINAENLVRLERYVTRFMDWCGTTSTSSDALPLYDMEDISRLQQAIIALRLNIHLSGRTKRMAILGLSSLIARSVGGGRVTCCKSAKDRTSMSITLEEAKLLVHSHGLFPDEMENFTNLLRTYGVRRENARKNIGKAQYCFSALQNYMLPQDYQCPPGTGGGSRSFS